MITTSPAVVTGSATTETTAAFTPPGGAVLAALNAIDTSGAGATTAITDTSGLGLVWTSRALQNAFSGNAGAEQIITATMPAAAAAPPGTAQLIPPGRRSPAALSRPEFYPTAPQQQPPPELPTPNLQSYQPPGRLSPASLAPPQFFPSAPLPSATQSGVATAAGAGTVTATAMVVANATPSWTPAAARPAIPGAARPGRALRAPVRPPVPDWYRRDRNRAECFTDQFGRAFMPRGDSIWGLGVNAGINGGATTWQSDIDLYMSTRASQGFNCCIITCSPCTDIPGVAADGYTWDGVAPGPGGVVGQLNPAYWTRYDYCVSSAQRNGITVIMSPCNEYAMPTRVAGGMLSTATTTTIGNYGTALAARWVSTPNLVWLMGNDYYGDQDSLYAAFLTALRTGGDNHLVTIENLTETDSFYYDYAGTAQPWGTSHAQFNWVYSYCGGRTAMIGLRLLRGRPALHHLGRRLVRRGNRHPPVRPQVLHADHHLVGAVVRVAGALLRAAEPVRLAGRAEQQPDDHPVQQHRPEQHLELPGVAAGVVQAGPGPVQRAGHRRAGHRAVAGG